MRTLVLMRHASAVPYAEADRERALTQQGREQARLAGEWLRGEGVVPTHALVSDAARTRETWTVVAEAAGVELEPEIDAGLYAAGPESALDLIQLVDPEAGTLLVIGHNPTISYLAQILCDDEGSEEAVLALLPGYPPASVTLFEVSVPWARLVPGTATIRAFRPGS